MISAPAITQYTSASYRKRGNYVYTGVFMLFFCLACASCKHAEKANDGVYESIFKETDRRTEISRYEGQHYLDSALATVPESTIPVYYKFQRYARFAGWTYFSGQLDSNGLYLDSMLQLAEANSFAELHPKEYTNVLNNVGDHYFHKNNFPKAFVFFSRSRIASLSTYDTCAYSNQTYQLGMVTYRQEKYGEAAKYFKEAYDQTNACSDKDFTYFRKEELLSNIGLAYTQLSRYDSASAYFQAALIYTDTAGKRLNKALTDRFALMARGVILGNLAKVHMATGHMDTAEQMLLESIAINSKPGYDRRDALAATMQLAELYFAWHKLPQTQDMLQQVAAGLAVYPSIEIRQRWMHLIYRYKKDTKDGPAAMQYLEAYLTIRDSLDLVNKKIKQTDYVQLLEKEEAQYKIKFLAKNSELNRLYLFIALGLSAMTIIVIILVYVYYRRSRKNVKLLTLLNHRVRDQKAELELAMRQLQHSNNDKDRILHVVAHDLRNPINAIQSIINIIQMDEVTDEQKELLDMMSHASDNSLLLISEILEFSGNNTGNLAGEKERTDLNELVKQAVNVLHFKAEEKKQLLNLVMSDEPLYAMVYPGKIGRVFGNLISNAIKFSPEGAEVTITVGKKAGRAVVIVKDNGVGIPEKNAPKVFDSFTTAKRLGTAGEASFGLGLSICKQIIDAAGGKIWLESTEGVGSSFFVELPLTS